MIEQADACSVFLICPHCLKQVDVKDGTTKVLKIFPPLCVHIFCLPDSTSQTHAQFSMPLAQNVWWFQLLANTVGPVLIARI